MNMITVNMLRNKVFNLFFQSFADLKAESSKENIRSLVGNGKQPLLQSARGIFKADIEGRALRNGKIPNLFALRDTHAPVKHQPRLPDLRGAADDGKPLREQVFDNELCRGQVHIKKRISVNGVKGFSDV